ncbi:MAG TPA: hypothetical protein VF377_10345 [Acidimicrobiia bacterium]
MTQQPQDRAILTAEDVAELLSMNVQMVRRYGREGPHPAVCASGTWRLR